MTNQEAYEAGRAYALKHNLRELVGKAAWPSVQAGCREYGIDPVNAHEIFAEFDLGVRQVAARFE